ncbi:MAG: alkyldihydroxyacetonephosphate synthase [Chloroflexota bacterium]|nr:alkyldihydroxyacetonephosphate synthase [Chloroflexota bacterium]
MAKHDAFKPNWYEGRTLPGTYRSLFKWNDPDAFKHPNQGFYELLRDHFGLSDEDFTQPRLDMDPLDVEIPSRLKPAQLKKLTQMVGGEQNVKTDTYSRTHASYGAGMLDALRLRAKIVENICDVVLAPRDREDVAAVVDYCDAQRIPVSIYGGGSTVTRGMEAPLGGVCLDMSVHMHRVLAFSEVNQTITVEAGMWGPELEDILNHAPEKLGAKDRFTLGHFPQSYEHSSVGGWVVTRGAGQNSTYYGKIEDLVIAQDYVTPIGRLQTQEFPRAATGPDFDQVMMGGEGTFGVLTSATLRLSKYRPENTRRFSYLFKTWEDAQRAYRQIMQGEFGFPSVFRLSDPEETDSAMHIYHIHGTPADTLLRKLGYQPMKRCMLLGTVDGEAGFTRLVDQKIKAICRRNQAFVLTPFKVTERWEHSRFTDPYMREDLMDYGLLIDTLECAVNWQQLPQVHHDVRQVAKAHPDAICMTHISHAYPQGANLYFIFVIKFKSIDDYLHLQYDILEAIARSGAAMSHHHGIGKQTAPWLEEQIGSACMDVIRTLKAHFDPHHIMNPGGTLGLDMSAEQAAKEWGFQNQ